MDLCLKSVTTRRIYKMYQCFTLDEMKMFSQRLSQLMSFCSTVPLAKCGWPKLPLLSLSYRFWFPRNYTGEKITNKRLCWYAVMRTYENMVPKKAQICYFAVAHRYIYDAMPPGGSTKTVLLYSLSQPYTLYFCSSWHVSSVTWLHHHGLDVYRFIHPVLNIR